MRGLAVVVMLVGCAGTLRVPPERITRAETLPDGYDEVLDVVESCRARDGFEAADGEPLASFDCNRARLERVLAERASEGSAEMLVGTRCDRDGSVLSCHAVAARADSPAQRAKAPVESDPGPVPGPAAIERWDEARASAAFLIRVDFEPRVARFEREKRQASEVGEVAALPVSHRTLGILTTRCDADVCATRELRQGLRVAAGGLGASDLVGVRCFRRGDVRECVAEVAASEIDE